MHLGLDRGHFLSSTGQSQPFDASADGYSRGEGCGIFVLKRLVDAITDNDNIMGVIRGIEVNQSSLARSITHPHGPTQVALLNSLLANAIVDPPRVSVVEAHAAGTKAGDPNEVRSIRRVLSADREADNPLYITSIKANIGHLEAASGAAGLAKLLLMLQHNCMPSQISLKNLDPEIDPLGWDNTIIAMRSMPWVRPTDGAPRLAILNNYGAAGSNAALLLEEWVPPTRDPHLEGMPFVFGLSAKTAPALEQLRATYLAWLRDSINNPIPLSDLAYTATARRKIYAHRLAVTATHPQELIEKLAAAKATHHVGGGSANVVFVFSGQGGQYLGMGASIYKHSLYFRAAIDECHSVLTSCGFIGILAIVSPAAGEHVLSPSEEFQANQVAIFSVQYGLAKLWMSWGIKPAAVVGHRYVAAQYYDLDDAEGVSI
jgi:acyl transferase domain-containing protein